VTYKIKNIILLLVISLGVLSNGFAYTTVYSLSRLSGNASKISVEKGAEGQYIIKAWETLINNPLIRKDVTTLTSVSKILDNTTIANIISKSDIEAVVQKLAEKGVRCRTCASGNPAYKYLDEVLDDLEHGATKFKASYSKVVTDIIKGGNFSEGAMWVAEGVKKYGNDFPAGTTVFEEVLEGGVRRVDIIVTNGFQGNKDLFFEFKSVYDVPPSGFATQFIKDMDLGEVTDLNQLKWWFDGKKVTSLPKQQFLDQLETGLQSLNPSQLQSLIDKLAPVNNKSFNGLMNKINTEFTSIFSIK
jgi:hypothetical protein